MGYKDFPKKKASWQTIVKTVNPILLACLKNHATNVPSKPCDNMNAHTYKITMCTKFNILHRNKKNNISVFQFQMLL